MKQGFNDYISLAFRLLYSPVSILEQIYKCVIDKNVRSFTIPALLVQFCFYIITSSPILLLFYFLDFLTGSNLLISNAVFYFVGSVIGIVLLFSATWFFFSFSGQAKEKDSRLRAVTRLWLFAVNVGLLGILTNLFLKQNPSDFYFFVYYILCIILLGFYIQKTFQLMSVATFIDQSGFEKKLDILHRQRHLRTQYASIALVLTFNIIFWFILWIIYKSYWKDTLLYLTPTYIALGWLLGISLKAPGFRLFEIIISPETAFVRSDSFSEFDKKIAEILKFDEISNEYSIHERYLTKICHSDEKLYFDYIEMYYLDSPYKNEALSHFFNYLFRKLFDKNLLSYLNYSDELTLLKNLKSSDFSNFYHKRYTKILIEIKEIDQLFYEQQEPIERFLSLDLVFTLYKELQRCVKESPRSKDYQKYIDENRQFFIRTFINCDDGYLMKFIFRFFNFALQYIEEDIKDQRSHEIQIQIFSNSIKISKTKSFIQYQIFNNSKSSINIDEIYFHTDKKEIFIRNLEFERILNPNNFIQVFAEAEVKSQISCFANIEIKYRNNKELKYKNRKDTLFFDFLPEFALVKNPFSLRPINKNELFFGRENEISTFFSLINNPEYPSIITIQAERRMGKTSLLFYFLNNINSYQCFYIDLQRFKFKLKTVEGFFSEFASFCNFISSKEEITTEQFLNIITQKPSVFLVDELDVLFDNIDIGNSKKILNICRNQKSTINSIFVFSLPISKILKADLDIQNVLRSNSIKLVLLDKPESLSLISNPVKNHILFTPQALNYIFRRCGGFPNLLQAYCYLLIDYNNVATKSSEINFEIVNQFERSNRVSFPDLISVFIQSLEEDQRQFLQVLRANDNKLDLQDLSSQLIKNDFLDDAEKVIRQLLQKKIIEINNNQYFCVSEILIENV
jgi:hypothetical protein